MQRRKLKDRELQAIAEQQIKSASGAFSGELSNQRADALDYYLGEPYGDEQEGRSQVRTREVLETVEWAMPSIMRIIADADNAVEFTPVGKEDEAAAEQETDTVAHVFWKQNRGYHNLYTFAKDGLLSKTGILKIWWEESDREERETYEGLTEVELLDLMNDPNVSREIVSGEATEDGFNIVFLARSNGRIQVEPCPPEEFGVARGARSPYVDDADSVFHRRRLTKAELIEMGYSQKVVDSIPAYDDAEDEESLARRHLSDEQSGGEYANHWSMVNVWYTEVYMRIDRDGDSIAELVKVCLAGNASNYATGSVLLAVEEVDDMPFATWCPVPLTHKFYGLSLADLSMDIQLIQSTLLRGTLDNMYLANNQRTHVNERVNLDDMLTSRPGGVIRHEGVEQPAANVFPHPHQAVPQETFQLMEHLDERRKHRTGIGEEVAALDPTTLSNVNTGVAALAYDAARSKLELIARNLVEYGLKTAFMKIHALLRKHATKDMVIRIQNDWVTVNPSNWRSRYDLNINVGMGNASKERKLMAIERTLQNQMLAMQAGAMGVVMTPQHFFQALADHSETMGIKNVDKYWLDPRKAPPPQPKGPDPQMIALELEAKKQQGQMQIEQGKLAIEQRKAELDAQIKMAQAQAKEREMAIRAEMERIKQQLMIQKQLVDERSQVINATSDARAKALEQQHKRLETALDNARAQAQQQLDQYRAELQSYTALEAKRMEIATRGEEAQQYKADKEQGARAVDMLKAEVIDLRERLEAKRAPTFSRVERDESGRPVAVGTKRIVYRDDGLIDGFEE